MSVVQPIFTKVKFGKTIHFLWWGSYANYVELVTHFPALFARISLPGHKTLNRLGFTNVAKVDHA